MNQLMVLTLLGLMVFPIVSMEREPEVPVYQHGASDAERWVQTSALMQSIALDDERICFEQTPTDQKEGVAMIPEEGCKKKEDTQEGAGWWGTLSSVGSFAVAPVQATKKVARRFRTAEHNLRRAVEDKDYDRAKKVLQENAQQWQHGDQEMNGVDIFSVGKTQNKSALEIALRNADEQMVELLLQREHCSIKAPLIIAFLFEYNPSFLDSDRKCRILKLLLEKKHAFYYRYSITNKDVPFIKSVIDRYISVIEAAQNKESVMQEGAAVLNYLLPLSKEFCVCQEEQCECAFVNQTLLKMIEETTGQNALMSVARAGNIQFLSHLLAVYQKSKTTGDKLKQVKLTLNRKDYKGRTALWHAVKHLHAQTVKQLIDHGANKSIDRDNLTLEEFIRSRLALVAKRMQHAQEKLKQNQTNKNKNAANQRKGSAQQLPILAVYQVESLEKDKQRYKTTQDKLKEIRSVLGFKARLFE